MKFAVLLAACTVLTVTTSFAQTPSGSPSPAAPVVYEKRDPQGRIINRFTFSPDGSITHLALVYGIEAEVLTVQEDLDPKREPVRRYREQVDRRGRPVEREETTFAQGRSVVRKTKFKYDAQGRQTAATQVIE